MTTIDFSGAYHLRTFTLMDYPGETMIGTEEAFEIKESVEADIDEFIMKIGNVHFSAAWQSGIPADTIALNEQVVEHAGVETPTEESVLVLKPEFYDMVTW